MKKKLTCVLLLISICFCGCMNPHYKTYGDFLYEIVNVDSQGKTVEFSFINKKKVAETFIRIMGLSEEGKSKEIIVVPQYINNLEVREIGFYGIRQGTWHNTALKKVFIPFLPKEINDVIPTDKIMVLTNEIPEDVRLCEYVFITSFYHENENSYWFVPEALGSSTSVFCRFANVSYMYNYDNAPNDGYYWIDNCDYGSLISYVPQNPVRTGYLFGGWYKEAQCVNEWNFEVDRLPCSLRPEDTSYYKETILYAKWIKEV